MSKHIKELVSLVLPTEHWKTQLLTNWHSILGDLGDHVTLEKIDDHSLILGAFNSSWMHELHLLSPLIVSTINKHLDYPRIKFVRFKIATMRKNKSFKNPVPSKPYQKTINLSLNEQKALAAISDEQLRDALLKFLVRCQQKE